jgi:hypothetical protein
MKNVLLTLSFLLFLGIRSHAQTATTVGDPVEKKASAVATRLNLDEDKKKAIYNIFSQTEKRIADLAYGTDYTKLINYINQERSEMLKVALSAEEFSSYQKFYATGDSNEILGHIKKNNAFLAKQVAEEKKNKKLMETDKLKNEKEEEKQKAAEKKAADKQKADAKKADAKAKADAKKVAAKEKAAAKKEKEKLKKEEAKRKNEEKKNAAKQKALEKKQKELDKKLKSK